MSTNSINNNKRNKITAEQTITLIRLIRKYKCLWDANSSHFRNRAMCNRLYEKIGGYFQITGDEVRRKFRRLKNCYRQELRLMRYDRKEYTNLFYFDEMEFLKEQIETSLLKHNVCKSSGAPDVKEENRVENLPTESFEECYTIEDPHLLQFKGETTPHQVISIEKVEVLTSEEPETIESVSDFENSTDEFDTFTEYLASQLRQMDKLSALETMDELQRIVSKRRIENLKRDIGEKLKLNSQVQCPPKKSRKSDM